MDGSGMLEGCKDLHLPLERDLYGIGLRSKNVKKHYPRELKWFERTEIYSQQ
jgi:hypothetical protein